MQGRCRSLCRRLSRNTGESDNCLDKGCGEVVARVLASIASDLKELPCELVEEGDNMIRRVEPGARRLARGIAFTSPPGAATHGFARIILLTCLVFATAPLCRGYSLLTHEEIVDILWQDQIEPLLLKRYPGATSDQLRRAHAYAYGGSLLQDMGYYPFGNKFFSDLTHCVRTGDLISNLLHEATDLDQYAFALGAVGHYASDNSGHPFVNRSVALCFPKLSAKYGETVTYAESPSAHIRTEFGFDITQVAKQRYTSDHYHDFIGFEISRPLLERAFFRTYGLRLQDALGNPDLAIGTFRRAVSQVIPEMTRAAVTAYHPELVRDTRNFNESLFLYNLSRAEYEKEWGKEYRRPGFFTRVLGFLMHLVPKVGVFKALAFKLPTPKTEDLYFKSVNRTVSEYRRLLDKVADGNFQFPNMDCDTGRPTAPGEYSLTDETYARLLETLVKRGLDDVPPDLRTNILTFFGGADRPRRTRKERRAWQRTTDELEALKAGPGSAIAIEVRRRLLAPPPSLRSPKAKDA